MAYYDTIKKKNIQVFSISEDLLSDVVVNIQAVALLFTTTQSQLEKMKEPFKAPSNLETLQPRLSIWFRLNDMSNIPAV